MKISLKKINIILFIATFALKSITDAIYVSQDINTSLISLKYLTMAASMIVCITVLLRSNYKERVWQKDFFRILTVVLFFFLFTLIVSIISGRSSGWGELIKLLLGPVYAYLIINVFSQEDFYFSMKFILLFGVIGYILEIGTSTFTLDNVSNINFDASYSPFESSYAAGTAVTSAMYFIYFNKERKFTFISILFVILTFKRMSILFVVSLFVATIFIDKEKEIKRGWTAFEVILFTVLTEVYMYLLQPNNSRLFERIFGLDPISFTMGRSERYWYLLNIHYTTSGYGSTTVAIGRNMEMDFIKISLEMTLIGLIYFLFQYSRLSHGNLYCHLLMIYNFFNLLTSHSLGGNFAWTLKFLLIGFIIYKNDGVFVKSYSMPSLKISRGG